MRDDLVKILKSTVDLDINPDDILAIHRILGRDQRGPKPVIAKFKITETKVKVIRKRQDEQLEKHFSKYDHLTPLNAQLLRDLNQDKRIHPQGLGFRIAILENKSEKYMSVIVTCHNLHVCVLYN